MKKMLETFHYFEKQQRHEESTTNKAQLHNL